MKLPILFSVVLGHPGEAPATPEALMAMVNFIPKDTIWGITHAHRKDFGIIAGALGLGAKTVRIGFEDSDYLDSETRVDTNVPLVEKVVKLLHAMDKEAMTPYEARKMLNI
jgi:3-keto-5-aminohexanoate cleavage enzyme